MNDFNWAEEQIDYTDNIVDEIHRHINHLGMSLNRYLRTIQSASNRFERLLKEEERPHMIRVYKRQIEVNRRYLVVLNGMYEQEMSIVALAC